MDMEERVPFFDMNPREKCARVVSDKVEVYVELPEGKKLVPTNVREIQDIVYFNGRVQKDPSVKKQYYESLMPMLGRLGLGLPFCIENEEGNINIYDSPRELAGALPKRNYKGTIIFGKRMRK